MRDITWPTERAWCDSAPPISRIRSPLAAQIKVDHRKRPVRKYGSACVTRSQWSPRGWEIGLLEGPSPRPSWTPFPWAIHEGQPQHIHTWPIEMPGSRYSACFFTILCTRTYISCVSFIITVQISLYTHTAGSSRNYLC